MQEIGDDDAEKYDNAKVHEHRPEFEQEATMQNLLIPVEEQCIDRADSDIDETQLIINGFINKHRSTLTVETDECSKISRKYDTQDVYEPHPVFF